MAESIFLTAERFKAAAKGGELPPQAGLFKQFIAEVEDDNDSKRELLFTISTAGVDRDRDKIDVNGWKLDAYRKNPVVLWAHDHRGLPVARSRHIWVEGDKLKSVAEFVRADVSEFADRVYRLYREGFLRATSVGFLPKRWAFAEDADRPFGIDFEEQELLEYSAVPVPANADALMEASAAGIDIEPLREWARTIIMPKDIETIREFEGFLRDAGFRREHAKALASHGWRPGSQREVDPEACAQFCRQVESVLHTA
jgi:HK97 family phage prohead protease